MGTHEPTQPLAREVADEIAASVIWREELVSTSYCTRLTSLLQGLCCPGCHIRTPQRF